jgi:hypothetical protein
LKIYKIEADPRVKLDLQEAMDFLKSRRNGLDTKNFLLIIKVV